jgi:hypothetical protein
VYRLSAGGGATGAVSLHLGPSATDAVVDHFDSEFYDFLLRTSSLVTGATNNRSITIGIGQSISSAQFGTDGIFFLAFPGSTSLLGSATNNWAAGTRSASTPAGVDTGNAATGTTNWKHFRLKRTPSTNYLFYIDDMTTPVATISSGLPATPFNIGIRVSNGDSNAGAHTLDIDAFYYRTNSLGTRLGA